MAALLDEQPVAEEPADEAAAEEDDYDDDPFARLEAMLDG